jgi:predicted AAA+ superfamily ATPase
MRVASDYRPRLVDSLLGELLSEFPAISLVGPRASGKTTTALRRAKTVIRLDRPDEAAVFRTDPDAALRGLPEPIVLDEWQDASEVLGAVKRAVDTDPHPGRFILTGSVRAELDAQTWPGTGRVIQVPMTGLTVRETRGDVHRESFLSRIVTSGIEGLGTPEHALDVRDYVDLALTGMFPEPALRLSAAGRRRWMTSYVNAVVGRDALALEARRDPLRLRRFFDVMAVNSAEVTDLATLIQGAGIDRKTAVAYESLLRNTFIIDSVPAWFTNRLKRLVQSPKRYLVDPALIAAVTGTDTNAVLRDARLLGQIIDTFVAAQLRAELPLATWDARMFHLRQEGGRREVDLLIEVAGARIIGIEVKASGVPKPDAGRHLAWLRDELGANFLYGLVLYTGPRIQQLGDRIAAVPISTLWS